MQRDEVDFVPLAVLRNSASTIGPVRLNDVPFSRRVKDIDVIHYSEPIISTKQAADWGHIHDETLAIHALLSWLILEMRQT